MIMSIEHVLMLDKADELSQMIIQSEVMRAYQLASEELAMNKEAQNLIKDFTNIKDQYDDVQRFGHYHPDYHEIMKNVRSTKRKMDMNYYVADYKLAERNLQRFLDDVSEHIARSVSEQVMVPRDGLALTDGGCATGSCGTGGSCGCKAS